MLGYYIINRIGIDNFEQIFLSSLRNKNIINEEVKEVNILKIWFLTSLFHNVAYVIEKTPKLIDVFLQEVLGEKGSKNIPPVIGNFNWGVILGWNDNRYHLNELQKYFYGNDEKKKRLIDDVLNNALMIDQDHGVFSALILLNQLREEIEKDPLIFYIAGLSIALHNKSVWQNMEKERVFEKIKFDKYPIPFLLLYCDTVQEWGRQIRTEAKINHEPMLKGIYFDSKNEIVCNLLYEKQSLTPRFIAELQGIINPIRMHWSSEGGPFRFFINFCDKSGNALRIAI